MKASIRIMTLCLLVTAFGLSTCHKKQTMPDQNATAKPAAPKKEEMVLFQYRFNPNTLTIPVGTTVVFKNKDAERHNVRIAALGVDHNIDPNQTFEYTFSKKGEFAVDNRMATNPMSATIVVK